MNTPLKDSSDLRHTPRNVQTPFRLMISTGKISSEFTCTRAVRLVPGRRLVCFGDWQGQKVVAKFFLDQRRGKHHMAKESAGLAALASARIPVPEILFRGVVPPEGLPVLGLRRISPALSFADEWRRSAGELHRREILRRVAVLVADQHKAGIKQDDLHGGNFIVCGSQVFVVDGASVNVRRQGTPLPEKISLRNLALLFAFLPPESDSLIEDAFEVYAERRSWPGDTQLFSRLRHDILKEAQRQRRTWLEKIHRESTAFVCRRSWRRTVVCSRRDYSPAMAGFLADPDPAIEKGLRLKDGHSATVALVTVDGRQLLVKRYNLKSTLHWLKSCMRSSRAEISWENSHILRLIRVATPRPVGVVVRRWGPFRSTAYFICEYVEGPDAHTLLHAPDADPREAVKLAARFGDILQRFADHRISHGDLKATNFIVANDQLWVIDLDAMRRFRSAWRFRRAFAGDLQRLMRNWSDLPDAEEAFRRCIRTLRLR